MFDRKLKTRLVEAIQKRDNILHNEIQQLRLTVNNQKMTVTSRRILAMLYARLSVDSTVLGVVTITSLSSMQWYGDNKMEEYFQHWTERTTRLEIPLGDEHLRDLLHEQMLKSKFLEYHLRKWDDDTPMNERTHDQLLARHWQKTNWL